MSDKITLIHSEAECQAALAAVSPLFYNEPAPGSEAADFLEVMILLIEKYIPQGHWQAQQNPDK